MAETFSDLRKALEDLTQAYKKITGIGVKPTDYQKIENLEDKVQAKTPALSWEDFVLGDVSYEKKNITPSDMQNITSTSKVDSPFVIIASNMNLFKEGKKYAISSSFNISSTISPPFVQIQFKNDSTGTVLATTGDVAISEHKAELQFVYNRKNDEVLNFEFLVGGALDAQVEWSNIAIYRVEATYTEVQKKEAKIALRKHVGMQQPFFNAIRNVRGGLSVPIGEEGNDTINLTQLRRETDYLREKIERDIQDLTGLFREHMSGFTQKLEDEKEARINADNARYTKSEVKNKLDDYSQKLNKSIETLKAETADLNKRIRSLENRIQALEKDNTGNDMSKEDMEKEAYKVAGEVLAIVFENGYIQAPDMKAPQEAFRTIAFGDLHPWYRKYTFVINKKEYSVWTYNKQKPIEPIGPPNEGSPIQPPPRPPF